VFPIGGPVARKKKIRVYLVVLLSGSDIFGGALPNMHVKFKKEVTPKNVD